ncbi:TetR/AcrR family transcriptional regulator [Thalassotalea litorea]|uniref:TetR/AcrR family transcriptional regulator n=1 Tax=Thalassotalea litorea TaxID=2020715 RepID=UPI00373652E9
MSKISSSYHHGGLREKLLELTVKLVNESGTDAVSMRKLGEHLGVSRTALYHHFKNKEDLLSAVAAKGFSDWKHTCENMFQDGDQSEHEKLANYIKGYLNFAISHKQVYELMFGKALWLSGQSSDELKRVAYRSFEYHLELIKRWQQEGILSANEDSLRLAQVSWGALHGLSRLFIDGLYIEPKNLDAMADTVLRLLTNT